MRRAVLFVAVSLAAIMLLGSQASARPAATANTWAGVWDSDFGKMTLDAGGSGSYEGFTPGTVSGSITGNVNKGTWMQPGNPPKDGTFEWTLSADGRSFSGSWAYSAGGCGTACGWSGTCVSGPCTMNSTGSTSPPPPPPPPPPPATSVRVTLSVKAPDGDYGASARVANGKTVRFRALATPSLPAGAKVVIEYPWQGGVNSLAECGTAVCQTGTKYQNGTLSFHATVVKDGKELARSASVRVVWLKRVVTVSAALTVKAPKGRFASSARANVGARVTLRAVVTPRLPAGARVAVKARRLGTTQEYFVRKTGGAISTCAARQCEFRPYDNDPETWEFRAVVLRGSTELATSSHVTVIWCYCGSAKKVNVSVKYYQDGVTPIYSPNCVTTPDPFDQDWPGRIGPNHIEAIIEFRGRKDYLSPRKHVYLNGKVTSGGDFTDGIQAYDLDAAGIRIFPAARCRASVLKIRLVSGTATLEVTPTERILTTQVQVLSRDGLLGEACQGSLATLRVVDSDANVASKGIKADSYSLTGWTPACPHAHGFSSTDPIAFSALGPPGSWVGPWGSSYAELNCHPPDGSGRGISAKECA